MTKHLLMDPENFSYETIKTEIENIADSTTKAIVCFLYASGGRVSEANQVEKKDLTTQTIKGKEYLIIRIITLKKRKQKYVYRQVPVPLKEKWLVEPILSYTRARDDGILFPLHRATIYKLCIKATGFNPHGFRKLRATHLSQMNRFTDQQLVRFFGWSDSRPASIYSKLNLEDIVY